MAKQVTRFLYAILIASCLVAITSCSLFFNEKENLELKLDLSFLSNSRGADASGVTDVDSISIKATLLEITDTGDIKEFSSVEAYSADYETNSVKLEFEQVPVGMNCQIIVSIITTNGVKVAEGESTIFTVVANTQTIEVSMKLINLEPVEPDPVDPTEPDPDNPVEPTDPIDPTEQLYAVGAPGPAGGYIFYANFDETNNRWTYLEAAPTDLAAKYAWDSQNRYLSDSENGNALGENIGTGKANTQLMVSQEGGFEAARACNDYLNGGYSDWFWASRQENLALRTFLIGTVRTTDFLATFQSTPYFSSSQSSSGYAYYSYIKGSGNIDSNDGSKSESQYVRPIRIFYTDSDGAIVEDPADDNGGSTEPTAPTGSIGWVYYSDGTCSATNDTSKTAIGIVCEVTETGTVSKIISLMEEQCLAWAAVETTGATILFGATYESGDSNWETIKIADSVGTTSELIAENYPAFNWCINTYKTKIPESAVLDWYMPSISELAFMPNSTNYSLVLNGLKSVNSSYCFQTTEDAFYLSSTQGASAETVQTINGSTFNNEEKSKIYEYFCVRAMAKIPQ